MTHLCVSKLTIIGLDNGLSRDRCQTIIWTSVGIYNVVNWTLGNKLQWKLIQNIYIFMQEKAFENVIWKMVAILFRPQCTSLYTGFLFLCGYRWAAGRGGVHHTGSHVASYNAVYISGEPVIKLKSPRGQLAPGRFQFNFRKVIFKLNLVSGGWGISYEIALRWIPQDLTNNKSTLVQVMAWCHQATSHYLSQC